MTPSAGQEIERTVQPLRPAARRGSRTPSAGPHAPGPAHLRLSRIRSRVQAPQLPATRLRAAGGLISAPTAIVRRGSWPNPTARRRSRVSPAMASVGRRTSPTAARWSTWTAAASSTTPTRHTAAPRLGSWARRRGRLSSRRTSARSCAGRAGQAAPLLDAPPPERPSQRAPAAPAAPPRRRRPDPDLRVEVDRPRGRRHSQLPAAPRPQGRRGARRRRRRACRPGRVRRGTARRHCASQPGQLRRDGRCCTRSSKARQAARVLRPWPGRRWRAPPASHRSRRTHSCWRSSSSGRATPTHPHRAPPSRAPPPRSARRARRRAAPLGRRPAADDGRRPPGRRRPCHRRASASVAIQYWTEGIGTGAADRIVEPPARAQPRRDDLLRLLVPHSRRIRVFRVATTESARLLDETFEPRRTSNSTSTARGHPGLRQLRARNPHRRYSPAVARSIAKRQPVQRARRRVRRGPSPTSTSLAAAPAALRRPPGAPARPAEAVRACATSSAGCGRARVNGSPARG